MLNVWVGSDFISGTQGKVNSLGSKYRKIRSRPFPWLMVSLGNAVLVSRNSVLQLNFSSIVSPS